MSAPEPRGKLAALLPPGRHGAAGAAPVRIMAPARSLVQLSARKGRAPDIAAALLAAHRLVLPAPGHAAHGDALAALWVQPDAWLLMAPGGAEGALARAAKRACGDAASVVDQSHGRAVIRLAGAHAPAVLARLCRIDLHPRAFGVGRVAVTPVADLPCVLHQSDAEPGFDLIFPATYAGSFVAALTAAAAQFGYDVTLA